MPRICLSMIVRNEAKVLPRSLASFRALTAAGADLSYCILDGGSTDGTPVLIATLLDDIPGEVRFSPQPDPLDDFSRERNKALACARPVADWILVLDADDEIRTEPGFTFPNLAGHGYEVLIRYGDLEYYRPMLISAHAPWEYREPVHEYLHCPTASRLERLEGIWVQVHPGQGARSADPVGKFRADAAALRRALAADPSNARNQFYLAQSLRDAGDYEGALDAYERRAAMPGWDQETYYALLQVARLKSWMDHPAESVIEAFLAAHDFREDRGAETLGMLAEYCRHKKVFRVAKTFARAATTYAEPVDVLFVTPEWAAWRALDEYAIACYWTGYHEKSARASRALLDGTALPAYERERVAKNLAFAQEALNRGAA